jgi:hypothetical protein
MLTSFGVLSPRFGTAVFTRGLPIVGFGTLLHKTSFPRRPTKARQNIYRASIAYNNTILDVHRQPPQGSSRKPFCGSDLPYTYRTLLYQKAYELEPNMSLKRNTISWTGQQEFSRAP